MVFASLQTRDFRKPFATQDNKNCELVTPVSISLIESLIKTLLPYGQHHCDKQSSNQTIIKSLLPYQILRLSNCKIFFPMAADSLHLPSTSTRSKPSRFLQI
ncbi:unnamed protein product [Albugo candida]|uniref:Uncharacterized protein n=1 Tax=Albugo candida TaxID=65357 RepID=A0A024FVT8_9STRA|nr:unnamed protein product [Albugo candida]|eukprot:CCI11288.1 unnamed protein product [Albugo candida]